MKLPAVIPIFGDTAYRGPCPSETVEQVTFFSRIRKTPLGKVALHIRNEGKRTYGQHSRHKAEGMVKGASDIIIPYHKTIVIELKRRDHTKSTISKEQIAYLNACIENGCLVCVALGADAAMQAVEQWTVDTGFVTMQ